MEIEINSSKWTIEEVEASEMQKETDNDYTMGLTIYIPQKILLLKGQANIIKTLKHELTHAWLYEYGHKPHNNYDHEDICEIVSSINNFINEIVSKYKGGTDNEKESKKRKICRT